MSDTTRSLSRHRRHSRSSRAAATAELRPAGFFQALHSQELLLLRALLAVLVVTSLLAVGTVHVSTLICIAPVSIAAGALVVFFQQRPLREAPLPAVVLALLGVWSFAQSLLMPMDWLRHLSPVAARTWQDAAHLSDTATTAWASISVDPGASRVEALKWFSYATAFTAASHVGRRRGNKFGGSLIVASTVTAGLLTVLHGLMGLDKWFGIYQPEYASFRWAPAPLLNPNNYAGYLNLGIFAGLGLLLVHRPPVPRWVLAVGLAALGAIVVLTASRGGTLALLIGLGLGAVTLRTDAKTEPTPGARAVAVWLPIAGVALAGAVLVSVSSNDAIWTELLDESTTKLRMIDYTRPILREHPWFGIGRGAFETVYSSYRTEPGHLIFPYAENFVVQWLVEWGVPVGVVGLGSLFILLRPSRLGFRRHPLATAGTIGVIVLLLQNTVDPALEVPAVGFAVAVLLGSLWGGRQHQAHPYRPGGDDSPTNGSADQRLHPSFGGVVGAIAVLSLGGAAVAAAAASQPDATTARLQLHAHLQALHGPSSINLGPLRDAIRDGLRRHPGDPYVPLAGAMLARYERRSPIRWLNQALRRDPQNARAYLLLSDVLSARGAKQQALSALRSAAEREPTLASPIAQRAVRLADTEDSLLMAVPGGTRGTTLLNALHAELSRPDQARLRLRMLQLSLVRSPLDVDANRLMARHLLTELDRPDGSCANEDAARCKLQLQQHVAAVQRGAPNAWESILLQSQFLVHGGRADLAELLLGEKCSTLGLSATDCTQQRVQIAATLPNPKRFTQAATAHLAASCADPEQCAQACIWLGERELERNNATAALVHFERAAREYPTAETWVRVSQIAIQLGRLTRAHVALDNAKRLGWTGSDAALKRQLESRRRDTLLGPPPPTSP